MNSGLSSGVGAVDEFFAYDDMDCASSTIYLLTAEFSKGYPSG
jgi:hypothetical protein